MKLFKYLLLTSVLLLIGGCASNQAFVGEGIYLFESYSYKNNTSKEDCSLAGGQTISDFDIIGSDSVVKPDGAHVVADKYIKRMKRSIFVSGQDKEYECVNYGSGLFRFLKTNLCCFKSLPYMSLDTVNKIKEEAEKVKEQFEKIDAESDKLNEYLRREQELNKILEQELLEIPERPNVPKLPVISDEAMEMINKMNECIERGKAYDRETKECE
ncbi:MAG: hypothetical protein J7L96_00590 [Bacteroidales bacterium]|nr:hypothetical protein [Bacteroidales bacterium]